MTVTEGGQTRTSPVGPGGGRKKKDRHVFPLGGSEPGARSTSGNDRPLATAARLAMLFVCSPCSPWMLPDPRPPSRRGDGRTQTRRALTERGKGGDPARSHAIKMQAWTSILGNQCPVSGVVTYMLIGWDCKTVLPSSTARGKQV